MVTGWWVQLLIIYNVVIFFLQMLIDNEFAILTFLIEINIKLIKDH